MKRTSLMWLSSTLLAAAAGAGADSSVTRFDFDADKVGQAPSGFESGRTGRGRLGKWLVKAEADAPSPPNVLAQVDADPTDYRFPVAFTGPELKDLRLSVKCQPVSGRMDQ
ncbi:MAG TPA: hypothetical protein VI653_24205, partial [Steroidobacteraceae bacterium]